MPVCRSPTCWASRSLLVPLALKCPTGEVLASVPLFLKTANVTLNKVLKCCCVGFAVDSEADTEESETERWARERRERRQARARRKAQRTGEVNAPVRKTAAEIQ